jgi:acyl-coenzyme A synthetase/AMP-(fatty) acid ligase
MTELFNASEYVLDRQVTAGNGARLALTGAARDVTCAELQNQVMHTASALRGLGLQPEQRVLMFTADSPELRPSVKASSS